MQGILLEAVLRALGDHEVHEATVAEIKVRFRVNVYYYFELESNSNDILKILYE
jgi:hypothetical protein